MPIPWSRRHIKKLRAVLRKDPKIDVWAIDEVHFQQHGSRCRMWIPPEEKDPVVYHASTRKSVGYFGAVRLRDGKFIFCRETGKFNAQTFAAFLRTLWSAHAHTRRQAIVISDNARYHHAVLHRDWRDEHEPRLTLNFLPPYSPELNPIERVWKLTRRLCLHNRYFADLTQVITTVERQFANWATGNETLRRLCAFT